MKTNKKMVVWDLFGGGCNSVAKAIDNGDYEIYTFDVVPKKDNDYKSKNYHYYELDLACGMVKNDNTIHKVNGFGDICVLFEELHLPKPDIIVSSTLCQSFSNVLSLVGGGTCFWKKENRYGTIEEGTKLIERSIDEFEKLKVAGFTKNLKADKQLFIKRLGEQCVINTIKLIKKYKPKYWYIENPASSLIWFYIVNNLKLKGFLNKASLGAYGYPIAKYGCFFSNVKMNLNNSRFSPSFKEHIFKDEKVYILNSFTLEELISKFDKNEKRNFVYASCGIAYKDNSEKKLICNNFYTYWDEISKNEYDSLIEHIESLKKNGSSGDKRIVKEENGKYFKRYYVEIGWKFGDKGHYSLKKTSITLGSVSKKRFTQEKGLTTIQLNEASETSHIPSKLILDIFSFFKGGQNE